MDFNEEIELTLMVTGHKKNVIDGSFGHVKRRLKKTDTRSPLEMMNVVQNSSSSNFCVSSSCVARMLWKTFLENNLRIPGGFTITKYHVFSFVSDSSGTMLF